MSHNIYRDSTGKDCMFVVGDRKAAWHELGQRVDGAVSWEQAMQLAGLNWKVAKQLNYARNPEGKVVPTRSYTIFRDSDNAELGTVGIDFTIRQNEDHFRFVDTLLEANGGSHYDSAGALGNGARIWCAVRVPKADITVAGTDKSECYLVFTSAHDGSMAHTAKLSTVRVVCQNTLSAALSDEGACFRVKHTRNAAARLDRAKDVLSGIAMDSARLADKLNLLASRRLTRESMTAILDKLFPKPKPAEGMTEVSAASETKRDNLLADVLKLYESNDRDTFPVIRGTPYNLLNAVTEYTDHFRNARITGSRAAAGYTEVQARAENAVSGTGDKLKAQALEVILAASADAPSNPLYRYATVPVASDSPDARDLGLLV